MTQSLSATHSTRSVQIRIPPAPSGCLAILCKKVSDALVAAQRKTAREREDLLPILAELREALKAEYHAQEINLPTSNGTTINGLHFPGSQKKALIYLHGNGDFYETAAGKPLRWREGLKIGDGHYPHLVVCNRGGTGKSEGNTHPLTVAREVLAQVEYLVREHSVSPNDIVIAGYSMGGYLGVFGAALTQQRFPEAEINFLSERSFDDIYSRVRLADRIIRWVMIISIFLTRWAQDSVAALETLKGRVCIVYHPSDGVVLYEHSTHNALVRAQRSRSYVCLALQEGHVSGAHAHNREFTEDENQQIVDELKRMLRI